ncbi:MAG: TraB/GumN family protein [Treponema sp.]|nr:TraB/GumN family protein [Treponema sp.]
MKKFAAVCCAILLIAGFLSCASAPVVPSASYGEMGDSPVWRISKGGNELYLGGSIHVLRDSDLPLPPEFYYAFSLADSLALEADTDKLNDDEIIGYLMYNMIYSDGRTLDSVLSPDTYQTLIGVLLNYGLQIDEPSIIKPSMIINVLSLSQIEEFGFTEQGVDFIFLDLAKKSGRPVHYLESVESQIEMIVSMGEGYEDEFVLYSLQDMDSVEEGLDTLVFEWKNGITSGSVESLAEMKSDWPSIYKSIITDRHDAWMPQIERFIASGSTYFVIVGFLHMPGPDGLLARLQSLGYTVEQL